MNQQGSHLLCPPHQVCPPHHPSSQLKPEPASEALVKDREALCICSSGHACNFHKSLPNSRGHRTYLRVLILLKQCSILNSGLRLVAQLFLLYLLCSLKPQPFPQRLVLHVGFASSRLTVIVLPLPSAYSILNCDPNIGSGP